MRTAADVYTGWHPIAERDASFHPGFTEWELVRACRPRCPGHAQPKVPLLGEYDDTDPIACGRRLSLAMAHGIDAFVFGVFWCRGKRVFEQGLDRGFLQGPLGATAPFACMWANRMPRRVLPVPGADLPVLDPSRFVPSDASDFVQFVEMLATNYFHRPNYVTVGGRSYLSIFDSTFFVKELGQDGTRLGIAAARRWLREHGHRNLHLAAIEPNADTLPLVRQLVRAELLGSAGEAANVAFQAAFGGPATAAALQQSLATFVRGIVAGDAPYDRFLKGDTEAMTPLRGVRLTAPYMHDSSLRTLDQVVAFCRRGGNAKASLDRSMKALDQSDDDQMALVALLMSL